MGIETIAAPPTQHIADFRLFGPHLLFKQGSPILLPPHGSSELLAILLLAPGRHVNIDGLRSAMENRRYLNIHAGHAADDLNTALNGTGLRVHTRGVESAREHLASGGWIAEQHFALIGGPIELDLDRCGALIGAALDAPSVIEAIELLEAAQQSIEGKPLEGVANTGSQFTRHRANLREAHALLTALRLGLHQTHPDLRRQLWKRLADQRNPVIAGWNRIIGPGGEAPDGLAVRDAAGIQDETSWAREESAPTASALELPASIFLGDGASAAAVEAAIALLLAEVGLEAFGHEPPVHGSWYQNLWVRVRGRTSHLSAEQLTAEIERKLRIEVFDRAQAAIDLQQATGAAALITALQPEEVACIRLGSMLLVKLDGTIQVTNLTQVQIAWIERNQTLLRDPEGLLKGLDALAADNLPHSPLAPPAPPPAAIEARE